MKKSEYADYDALGLKQLLDNGDITAQELNSVALDAIEKLNPTLNFLVELLPEESRRALVSGNSQFPFSGIPFLMKDSNGMAGQSLQCGMPLLKGLKVKEDLEISLRIKSAGLVTLGGSTITELIDGSSPLYGPVANPWDLGYSAGFSSSGSAAAVAAGVVPMAHSSDAAGSIRLPAHCCGVFGFMPSRGRTPVGPGYYGGRFGSLRHHVITRSVRDSAAMLDHLSGPEEGALFHLPAPARSFVDEMTVASGQMKIAFTTTSPSGEPVAPECIEAVEKAIKLCEEMGHEVENATPYYDWEVFCSAVSDQLCFGSDIDIEEIAGQLGREVDDKMMAHSSLLMLEYKRGLSNKKVSASSNQLHHICADVETFFSDIDILISPVALTPAPELGLLDSNAPEITSFSKWMGRILGEFAAFTPIYNFTGQPAMSVPLYHSKQGLPVGVQCAAKIGNETALIRLASQFEKVCPWIDRKPPISIYS